jgi:hypothetical protein
MISSFVIPSATIASTVATGTEGRAAAGYDTELVRFDGGREMAPGSERFETWVMAIAEPVHGLAGN